MTEPSDWWRTSISDISPGSIRYRGYSIQDLIGEATYASMVWLLLRGELPTRDQEWLLERALVAAVDHGPQAPSIAISRISATCGVDINNVMASAINSLGDVHGGAGQQLMALLDDLLSDDADTVRTGVTDTLAEYRAAGLYIPGFGHRFHSRDPRRDPLITAVRQAIEAGAIEGRHLAVGLEIERQLGAGRDEPVPMNVDGCTAIIYAELGFAPELGRGLFVLSRSVGALAHGWEESQSGLRNKGPIPIPLLPTYDGPFPRPMPDHTKEPTHG